MGVATLPASEAATYRAQRIRSLCVACNEEAHTSCRRCGAPHCNTHHPSAELRCSYCEAFFATARAHRIKRPLEAWMLALIYLCIATIGAALTWAAAARGWIYEVRYALLWALGLVFFCGLAPLWVALTRRARLRPAFLAEDPQRRLVAVPEVEIEVDPPQRRNEHEVLSIISASLLGLFFVPFVIPVTGLVLSTNALLMARREGQPSPRTAILPLALHGLLLAAQVTFLFFVW